MFASVDATREKFSEFDCLADIGLSTSLFLALRMGKALFLDGESGVGKIAIGKVLARIFNVPNDQSPIQSDIFSEAVRREGLTKLRGGGVRQLLDVNKSKALEC